MSENYNDKDIEKLIFGEGLASGSIEPSESFWNKAYEDILHRENKANLNRISRWKAGFFIAGTIALFLGSYVIYMHTEVSGIKQQLTKIEGTQANTIRQITNQNMVTHTDEKSTTTNNLHSTISRANIQQADERTPISTANTKLANTLTAKRHKVLYAQYINSLEHNKATTTPPLASIASNSDNNQSNINSTPPKQNEGTADINNPGKTIPSVSAINSNNNPPDVHNLSPLQSKETADNAISNVASPNNISPTTQNPSTQAAKAASTNKKNDSAATKTSVSDSISIVPTPKKPITLAGILSKISVSAFYAPGATEDFLKDKDNDPTHTITAHLLKTQQDGDGTFATGLHLAYDISNKWSIQTGAYYSQYTYNINPTIIYAQQQENGQVGYSVTTSSGTVFLPNSAVPAHLGDSIKLKGSSSRGYISIPLQLKYKFATGRKFNIYLDGGFCMNIAIDKQTTIHWENTALQEGDLTVPSIYGLNAIQYSYNFGIGAEYLMGKGLSIYTEPFMNGSFTSINKNTPVITYPYFFGLAFGLAYHF